MRLSSIRIVLGSLALGALIVYTTRLAEHPKAAGVSPPMIAVVPTPPTAEPTLIAGPAIGAETQLPVAPAPRSHLVDNCFTTDTDLSSPIVRGKNAVVAAAMKAEWEIVRKLIDAGAPVESADETGLTALMVAAQQGNVEMLRTLLERQARVDFMDFEGRTSIHYAMSAGKREAVELLLSVAPTFDPASGAARNLLTAALASGDMAIFQTLLERFPPTLEWTADAQHALEAALRHDMKEQVRLLLSKHPAPPTRPGGVVPLIAYAIATDDAALFQTLLSCGSDPNLAIPKAAEKEFMGLIKSKYLRLYIQEETGVNLLMLAAGLGKTNYVRALLDAGADRNRHTPREKMLPLYFAAWTENWQCVQMLLGGGPQPEQLRVEVSLAKQHMDVIKDGISVFTTKISTGRDGFTTKPGYYVITDKDRDHRSTIYKCPMPYFMRLSCRDFGLHEGVVQPYPASHGCIRLPGDAAKKLFVDLPIGTVVNIN
ncbi:MAG TPA: ankyrin repeat domain-containing protein [Chthoniobacterales bacterium]|nr:ankyrin repeat domain-containing protein [Chthoniobacterales bacterium]